MMPGFGCCGNFGAFGWIGLALMVLFWGLIIAGGFWLIKSVINAIGQSNRSGSTTLGQPFPREVLDLRYARGEISREEYEILKKDLSL